MRRTYIFFGDHERISDEIAAFESDNPNFKPVSVSVSNYLTDVAVAIIYEEVL